MKRLFIAAPVTGKEKDAIKACQARPIEGGTFVALNQIHLTLRFLGDTEKEKEKLLIEALGKVQGPELEIQLSSPRFLGKPRHPSAFAMGIEPTNELMSLQKKIEEVVVELGFEAEGRPYVPHTTLARLKRKFRFTRDSKQLEATYQCLTGTQLRANHFALYASELTEAGAIHSVVKKFPLSR